MGRCYYYNQDFYYGEWKDGQRHGSGEHFYRKGERYIGLWVQDRREAPNARLISANGQSEYIGGF